MSGGHWKEFFYAAKAGDLELVSFHIAQGIDVNYQHPEVLTTALLEAIRMGHLKVIAMLLKHGASLDIKEHWGGETPESQALKLGHMDVIALLGRHKNTSQRNQIPKQAT